MQDGEVVIVDEFTGRIMPGRRWSDGLHQAIEAKEGVKIERENQTLATITFQNYFRMYKKLAGMTGTAETEAAEFYKIYKLEVTAIPTNRPMIRKEYPDIVYRTEEEKFRNAAKFIKELNEKGQPVLVGTISVEKSEVLVEDSQQDGRPARGSEREESRARSLDRRAGGPQRRGHGIDQHGRPRYRHSARRQCRSSWRATRRAARVSIRTRCLREEWQQLLVGDEGADRSRARRSRRSRAACTLSAPSGTSRAVSTISFADAPDVRAIPAHRGSSSRLQDDLLRIFGGERIQGSDAAARHGRRCADRVEADHAPYRGGAEGCGSAELRSP